MKEKYQDPVEYWITFLKGLAEIDDTDMGRIHSKLIKLCNDHAERNDIKIHHPTIYYVVERFISMKYEHDFWVRLKHIRDSIKTAIRQKERDIETKVTKIRDLDIEIGRIDRWLKEDKFQLEELDQIDDNFIESNGIEHALDIIEMMENSRG